MTVELNSRDSLAETPQTSPLAAVASPSPASSHRPLRGILLGFAAMDFAIIPCGTWLLSDYVVFRWYYVFCVGAIVAQAGLQSIWFVLAPFGLAQRFLSAASAGLVLFGVFVLGGALYVHCHRGAYPLEYWRFVLWLALSLPLLLLAVQSPLWFARIWLNWRVVHGDQSGGCPGETAFGIRHIFAATACVALALAGVRLAASQTHASPSEQLVGFSFGALIAAAISLITTLPATVVALRARRPWRSLGALFASNVIVVLGAIAVVSLIAGRWPPLDADIAYLCLLLSFYVCLAGPLLLARRLGYRLVWGSKRTTGRCTARG